MARANPIRESITPVPRLPTHVVIYKIPASPFWWTRYYADKHRYVIRSTKTTVRQAAFNFARQLFIDGLTQGRNEPELAPKTFKAVANSLLSQEAAAAKASLYQKDKNQLENFLYEHLGGLLLKDITHHDLNKVLAALKDKHLSPATKKHYLGLVRKVFTHGVSLGVIHQLPLFPKLGEKLQTQKKRDYLAMGEYQSLSKFILKMEKAGVEFKGTKITSEFKILVNFMINSFIRPSDLRVLQHKHVTKQEDKRLNSEWLTLHHPATKTTAMEVHTMPHAVDHYQELIALRKAQFKCGETHRSYTAPDDYLFLPQYENRETAMLKIGRIFSFIIDRSGLAKKTGKNLTLYSLRHTAIMYRLMNSDIDSLMLAKNARTSQAVIEKFYGAHLTTEQSRIKLHSFRSKRQVAAQGDALPNGRSERPRS